MQLKSLKTGQLVKVGYTKYYVLGVFYNLSLRFFYPDATENIKLAVVEQENLDFNKVLTVDDIEYIDSASCIYVTNKHIDKVKKWITKSLVASEELRKNFGGIMEAESCTSHLHELFTESIRYHKKFKSLLDKEYKGKVIKISDIKENRFYLFETGQKRTLYMQHGKMSYAFPCVEFILDSLAYDKGYYISDTYACHRSIVYDRQLIDVGIDFLDMHLLQERLAT